MRKNNNNRAYQLVKGLTVVKQGNVLMSKSAQENASQKETLNRWTECCSELCNHKDNGDLLVLHCPQIDTEDDHPFAVSLCFGGWVGGWGLLVVGGWRGAQKRKG